MQMINLMKRLAELDANNPNIVKEATAQEVVAEGLDECGTMGGMSQPHTPASINVTASSGEELSAMLGDILSLAGLQKVEPEHLGIEHEPAVVTMEPDISVSNIGDAPSMMRSMMDRLNADSDEQNTHEESIPEVDNEPEEVISADGPETAGGPESHDQSGHPGVGDRMDGDRPKAFATEKVAYESLMSEYQKYLSEN